MVRAAIQVNSVSNLLPVPTIRKNHALENPLPANTVGQAWTFAKDRYPLFCRQPKINHPWKLENPKDKKEFCESTA